MTGSEKPAGSAGREMKPLVEGQTVSCKMDLGARQGWQAPRKERCGSRQPVVNRERGRAKIRIMVRDHGLVLSRIGPDAACVSAFGREIPV